MGYIYIIIIISGIIIIHELGHFFSAKLFHLPVKQFSLGFGPALFSFRIGNTTFKWSILPIGGYVLLDINSEQDYFDIPVGRRILFSLGGPLMNFLIAYLLLILYSLGAFPLTAYTIFVQPLLHLGTIIVKIFEALSSVFSHPEQLSGVIGIVSEGGKVITATAQTGLFIAVFLSINVGIINLLPLPALDGGKILLACIEKLNPMIRKVYTAVSIAGWIIIISLFIFTTVTDIQRLAS